MRKREWTYLQLATQFGVSEAEARRWAFREGASNRRNPPAMAFILAELLDKNNQIAA
jgi:hypothetical protein